MAIDVSLKGYDEVIKGLGKCQKDLAKGVRRVQIDTAKRGVKTVMRSEVTEVYNIKKSDVSAKSKGYKQTGSVPLAGVTIPVFKVEFEQHGTFTPIHFGMKPKTAPRRRGGYPITWQPLTSWGRGRLKGETNFPPFLVHSDNRNGNNAKVEIPFERTTAKSWRRSGQGWVHTHIQALHTHMSVPQMIDNLKVMPNAEEALYKRIEKELDRVLSRAR